MGRIPCVLVACLLALAFVFVLALYVAAFCILLTKSSRTKANHSLRGDPLETYQRNDEGYELYLDGAMRTPLPRNILDYPPAEMFYSIPLTTNPSIKLNKSGYVLIPKLVSIKVSYVRDLPFIGGFEYGVANWKWNANPVSAFSDKVVAGTAEKMLTLSHKGFWRTDSKDYALKKHKEQGPIKSWLASKIGWYRNFLVNSFAITTNPGVQLRDAGLTEDTYKDLQRYAMKDEASPPQSMRKRVKRWRENLTAEALEVGALSSLDMLDQTAVNSFHVEGTTGAHWTAEGLYLPIDRKIAMYRVQSAQGPLRTYNVASGIALLQHNTQVNRLEIYFYANNYLNVPDPFVPNVLAPHLYTSPLPGEHSNSIVPDSRQAIGWVHFNMETPLNDTMEVTAYKHRNEFTMVDVPIVQTNTLPFHV